MGLDCGDWCGLFDMNASMFSSAFDQLTAGETVRVSEERSRIDKVNVRTR